MTSASSFTADNYSALFSSDISPNLSLQDLSGSTTDLNETFRREESLFVNGRRRMSYDKTDGDSGRANTSFSRRSSTASSVRTANTLDSYDMVSSAVISLASRDDLYDVLPVSPLSDHLHGMEDEHGGYYSPVALEEENISVPAMIAMLILPHMWMLLPWFSFSKGQEPQQQSGKEPSMKKTGACPVDHSASVAECPVKHGNEEEKGCPVMHNGELQSSNNMPILSQNPAPGQQIPLPVERQVSSIPRSSQGDDNDRWVYPSQQQFYNALKRKNYETDERDISSILEIHNELNERCWQEILKWEKIHSDTCCEPKLLKFCGRPSELTPKARFLTFFGLSPKPFDRHDWVVDRCGKQVRYVIDYYQGTSLPGTAVMHVDVRPAIDNVASLYDRMRMLWIS